MLHWRSAEVEEVEPPTLLPEGAIFAGGDRFVSLSCSCWMYSKGTHRTSMTSNGKNGGAEAKFHGKRQRAPCEVTWLFGSSCLAENSRAASG